jgi:GYF domain 2
MTSPSRKPIAIVCPRCGLRIRVFRGAGPKVDCPSCGKTLKIVPRSRAPTRLPAAPRNQGPRDIEQWYYRVLGVEVGPLSFQSLRAHLRARRLGPDAQVRMGAGGRWVLAERVQDLQME